MTTRKAREVTPRTSRVTYARLSLAAHAAVKTLAEESATTMSAVLDEITLNHFGLPPARPALAAFIRKPTVKRRAVR